MSKLTTERRKRFLKSLIREGIINVLAEQEVEPGISSVPPAGLPPSPETNIMDPAAQPAPEEEAPHDEHEGLTVDSMVEKLNILRGGKSYTDPEIYGKLTTFFNGLTHEQTHSLEWLLNELNKIVVDVEANVPGEDPQAPAPSVAPPAAPPATPRPPPAPVTPV